MRYCEFGGKKVSVIAMGTSDFGGTCPAAEGMRFMDAYCGLGGNFIDTARCYGDFAGRRDGESEKVVGKWMADRGNRSELFLSTKGGHPRLDDMHTGRLSRAEILGDLAGSLEDLRTDYVDIYWLHRDDLSRPVGDVMETLTGIVESGRAKLVGVSNWTAARIREANAYAASHGLHPLDANQPQFSLARQMWVEDDTRVQVGREDWMMHRETGMPLVAFSSQAKGFFTKLYAEGLEKLSKKGRERFDYPENMAIYERILALSAETGLSVTAIAMAWVTCQPFPVFAIAGASRMEHVLSIGEICDCTITPEQRDWLFSYE